MASIFLERALEGSQLWWTAACLLTVSLLLISNYLEQRRFQAFARQNGCEEPYNDDWHWPWNVDRMYALVTARKYGKDPLDEIISKPLFLHHTLQRAAFGGGKGFETCEPANIKTILSTKFDDWIIGEARNSAVRPLMGNNIFSTDGAMWQHSRAMLRPQFAKTLVNNLERTEKSVMQLINSIGVGDDEGWTQSFDMCPMLSAYITDIATDFLFGESIGALDSRKPAEEKPSTEIARFAGGAEFLQAFDVCSYYCVLRIRMQGLKWLANGKKLKSAAATIRKVSDHYVNQALNQKPDGHQKEKFHLLSNIASHSSDRKELADQALGVMFAARDTTSTLILWAVLLLGQNQEVFQELRRVVLAQFSDTDGSVLDFQQLKDCTYLQWVLFESMRLYQPVPLNSREAVRDTILPVGGGRDGSNPIAVKKGQNVLFNSYAMQRREDIWGEDVLEFKPSRWANVQQSSKVRTSFAYIPFSGGPRACLGQQYALTEAAYALVRLLLHYDKIELAPDSAAARGEPVPKKIGLTLSPMELRLRFHVDASRDDNPAN